MDVMVAMSAVAVAVMVAVVVMAASPFPSFLALRDGVLTVTGQAHQLQGF